MDHLSIIDMQEFILNLVSILEDLINFKCRFEFMLYFLVLHFNIILMVETWSTWLTYAL